MAIMENAEQEQPINFDAIKIGLASPEKIREWSHGEVKKPETINYRTLKPEKDGLFCERIFGPSKDWECHCGKYKKVRYKGIVCDRCGVEVTKSSVRRERMGHIELAAPVSHIWYFKGIPSRMGLLLDLSPRVLERVLYFASYIVLDPGETDLHYKDVLNETEYKAKLEEYGYKFRVGMGAEAIKEMLSTIDLEAEGDALQEELETATGQKKAKIIKKLEVIEAFRNSNNKPEWMIMDAVPVIPPDIRPMVQLDGGRFATSDLNDLYRRIINRNNRLKRLLELSAPDIIVRNEKRMLQEAVDALIDNGRRGRPVTGPGNRALKSLSDMLKGKQGRFRQNLLGKRVDYSGRSVIVVGPELKIYQCGLPKEMAIELFKPFVMKELTAKGIANNIKAAKKMVERLEPQVWDILEDVIKEHPVMLNRAPTLHRLGIQAFEPILVEGKAIKLHPLVCTAFNADFDGDQMAVHLPLSVEAQAECRFLLLSPNNLLKPSDGGVVSVPSQDMVLGIYYLTNDRFKETPADDSMIKAEFLLDDEQANVDAVIEAVKSEDPSKKLQLTDIVRIRVIKKETKEKTRFYKDITAKVHDVVGHYYKGLNDALLAYENKEITLQQKIYVQRKAKLSDGTKIKKMVATTLGKLLFNEIIPQDLGFVDRSNPDNAVVPEINFHVGKKQLKKILDKCINTHGATKTAEVLDKVKAIGYKYSTLSGITVSVADMTVPDSKPDILNEAQDVVDYIAVMFSKGFLTEEERYNATIKVWDGADTTLKKALLDGLDKYNNIYMMADSGARGSDQQIKQLTGMRGLMADTTGKAIELPIKSNFREGLDVLEYFISAHGARKGLSDTALRTADSGYLTRRLVDVSQDLIIRETDCCEGQDEKPGIYVQAFVEGVDEIVESFQDRITGRYTAVSVFDKDGNMIVKKNHMITPKRAENIMKYGVQPDDGRPFTDPETGLPRRDAKLKIRSILTCKSHLGICAKCYGANMATGQAVQVGEAVGIIAAQSIGEPGTQLTMRTFHTGGVAGGDITQGLPRVEELFEARKPKGLAIIAEFGGKVTYKEGKKKEVIITNDETGESKAYLIPYGSRIKVRDGQDIEAGDELTEGSVNPHDILKIKGVDAVQNYMIREVQKVYRLQGVDINDKHIEIIVRQMLKKVRVEDNGDSTLLPGSLVDVLDVNDINEKLIEEGKKPVEAKQVLLGITKASLATSSFLSAASFQETTRVLTDAAIKGKVDPLIGLKENVLIGKLIPAGTGMKRYRSVSLDTEYINDVDDSFADDDSYINDADEVSADSYSADVNDVAADDSVNSDEE
ncbi:DNA-directed RNA polymerase subunit beta' [Eubacterium ruminantium]|uniref:DNA-directed RNA polymerase subunit beta' n=2 Tax=Eubacterium ruminantium TaxID=42322 RepID=A0A1T4PHL8_9FIRM|nr:DNA-directed RNA polymerase subunit beta' [Eubacterium ruminantium]SCW60022.1 DNA-directed RNA polymerase subunit beta' [Eubacterium ruminantium]SDN10943.1 DNA-directed RNA polymerase subunit beta' [Eubacterium ruminantium]SJZ91034.1 DNA-directed RNA polymerase subunit beta' [Eubacterium ruminantium]